MAETITQSKPFKQFKKGYRMLGREAPKLYNQTNSKPYAGDRVADFNSTQGDAFATLGGVANANTEFSNNMLDNLGGIAGGSGMAQGMGQPLNWIEKVGTGQDAITTGKDYSQVSNQMARLGQNSDKYSGVGDYKNLMGDANDKFYSERNLDEMARGRFVDGGNPFMNDIIRQTNESVRNKLNAQMAGSGAYGGSRYVDNMSRQLADSENNIRYQNYEAERGRQMQANQMLDAAQAAGFGQKATATQGIAGSRQADFNNKIGSAQAQMGALAGQTGTQAQNIQNQLTAANQKAGILQQGQANRLAAMGLSPNLQEASFLGGQALLGVGDRLQGQQQKEIDADKAYYEENRDQDWAQLAKLGQALGMGSQYGTQNQTTQASTWESILGGLLGAGSLVGSIF